MVRQNTEAALSAIAAEALSAIETSRSIMPFSNRPGGFSPEDGERIRPLLRAAFERRGERVLGRKVGFTNRRIWPEYGVLGPNWGYVTDRTVRDLGDAAVPLASLALPRIEPEIMFGLSAAPAPGMDDAALLGCIDWLSFGYEIVQSIYPNWKFAAADTSAANAMHGALLIGPRHAVAQRRAQWLEELARFDVVLSRNGEVMDRGNAANVLEGPLSVLRYLVDTLAGGSLDPPLAAGEIVSTGTLTRALLVAPGETWTAAVSGIPPAPITVTFA
jgi:2-keto-4-pentenoate hydratase